MCVGEHFEIIHLALRLYRLFYPNFDRLAVVRRKCLALTLHEFSRLSKCALSLPLTGVAETS